MRTTNTSEGSSDGTYRDLLSSLSLCDNPREGYSLLFNAELPFCSPILQCWQVDLKFLDILLGDFLPFAINNPLHYLKTNINFFIDY